MVWWCDYWAVSHYMGGVVEVGTETPSYLLVCIIVVTWHMEQGWNKTQHFSMWQCQMYWTMIPNDVVHGHGLLTWHTWNVYVPSKSYQPL